MAKPIPISANYSGYLKEKEERLLQQFAEFQEQQKVDSKNERNDSPAGGMGPRRRQREVFQARSFDT